MKFSDFKDTLQPLKWLFEEKGPLNSLREVRQPTDTDAEIRIKNNEKVALESASDQDLDAITKIADFPNDSKDNKIANHVYGAFQIENLLRVLESRKVSDTKALDDKKVEEKAKKTAITAPFDFLMQRLMDKKREVVAKIITNKGLQTVAALQAELTAVLDFTDKKRGDSREHLATQLALLGLIPDGVDQDNAFVKEFFRDREFARIYDTLSQELRTLLLDQTNLTAFKERLALAKDSSEVDALVVALKSDQTNDQLRTTLNNQVLADKLFGSYQLNRILADDKVVPQGSFLYAQLALPANRDNIIAAIMKNPPQTAAAIDGLVRNIITYAGTMADTPGLNVHMTALGLDPTVGDNKAQLFAQVLVNRLLPELQGDDSKQLKKLIDDNKNEVAKAILNKTEQQYKELIAAAKVHRLVGDLKAQPNMLGLGKGPMAELGIPITDPGPKRLFAENYLRAFIADPKNATDQIAIQLKSSADRRLAFVDAVIVDDISPDTIKTRILAARNPDLKSDNLPTAMQELGLDAKDEASITKLIIQNQWDLLFKDESIIPRSPFRSQLEAKGRNAFVEAVWAKKDNVNGGITPTTVRALVTDILVGKVDLTMDQLESDDGPLAIVGLDHKDPNPRDFFNAIHFKKTILEHPTLAAATDDQLSTFFKDRKDKVIRLLINDKKNTDGIKNAQLGDDKKTIGDLITRLRDHKRTAHDIEVDMLALGLVSDPRQPGDENQIAQQFADIQYKRMLGLIDSDAKSNKIPNEFKIKLAQYKNQIIEYFKTIAKSTHADQQLNAVEHFYNYLKNASTAGERQQFLITKGFSVRDARALADALTEEMVQVNERAYGLSFIENTAVRAALAERGDSLGRGLSGSPDDEVTVKNLCDVFNKTLRDAYGEDGDDLDEKAVNTALVTLFKGLQGPPPVQGSDYMGPVDLKTATEDKLIGNDINASDRKGHPNYTKLDAVQSSQVIIKHAHDHFIELKNAGAAVIRFGKNLIDNDIKINPDKKDELAKLRAILEGDDPEKIAKLSWNDFVNRYVKPCLDDAHADNEVYKIIKPKQFSRLRQIAAVNLPTLTSSRKEWNDLRYQYRNIVQLNARERELTTDFKWANVDRAFRHNKNLFPLDVYKDANEKELARVEQSLVEINKHLEAQAATLEKVKFYVTFCLATDGPPHRREEITKENINNLPEVKKTPVGVQRDKLKQVIYDSIKGPFIQQELQREIENTKALRGELEEYRKAIITNQEWIHRVEKTEETYKLTGKDSIASFAEGKYIPKPSQEERETKIRAQIELQKGAPSPAAGPIMHGSISGGIPEDKVTDYTQTQTEVLVNKDKAAYTIEASFDPETKQTKMTVDVWDPPNDGNDSHGRIADVFEAVILAESRAVQAQITQIDMDTEPQKHNDAIRKLCEKFEAEFKGNANGDVISRFLEKEANLKSTTWSFSDNSRLTAKLREAYINKLTMEMAGTRVPTTHAYLQLANQILRRAHAEEATGKFQMRGIKDKTLAYSVKLLCKLRGIEYNDFSNTREPDPKHIKALNEWATSKNVLELRAFEFADPQKAAVELARPRSPGH